MLMQSRDLQQMTRAEHREAHRPHGSLAIAPASHDEDAAERVEHRLVDIGGKYTEELLAIADLDLVLAEPKCRALLLRMKQRTHENETDLARLKREAKKQLRGSDD
jgi:hypothetical protein